MLKEIRQCFLGTFQNCCAADVKLGQQASKLKHPRLLDWVKIEKQGHSRVFHLARQGAIRYRTASNVDVGKERGIHTLNVRWRSGSTPHLPPPVVQSTPAKAVNTAASWKAGFTTPAAAPPPAVPLSPAVLPSLLEVNNRQRAPSAESWRHADVITLFLTNKRDGADVLKEKFPYVFSVRIYII